MILGFRFAFARPETRPYLAGGNPRHGPGVAEARIAGAVQRFTRPQRRIQPVDNLTSIVEVRCEKWIGECRGCSSPAAAISSASSAASSDEATLRHFVNQT
jgi:hypothetical protein